MLPPLFARESQEIQDGVEPGGLVNLAPNLGGINFELATRLSVRARDPFLKVRNLRSINPCLNERLSHVCLCVCVCVCACKCVYLVLPYRMQKCLLNFNTVQRNQTVQGMVKAAEDHNKQRYVVTLFVVKARQGKARSEPLPCGRTDRRRGS